MSCYHMDIFMVRHYHFSSVIFVMAAFIFLTPSFTCGGEFNLVPSVKVHEEYDDNILYSTDESKVSDFVVTFTPGVEFKVDDPRLAASLNAFVAGISYVDNNDLNAVDQFFTADLSYMMTQRVRTQVNLNYTRDSQRGRDIVFTGLPVFSTSGRERQQYNVAGDYAFSEKSSLNLSYGFFRDRYDNVSLIGFKAHSCGVGFKHDLSQYVPELIGTMNVTAMRYDYPSVDVQNTTTTVGVIWKYSETLSLSGEIGPRFTHTEFDVPVIFFDFPTGRLRTESNDGNGLGGKLAYAYQGLFTNWTLSISRDLDQSSGRSGTTERTTTGFDISRRVTEDFTVGIQSRYYLNQSDQGEFNSQEISNQTWQVQPRIVYKFSQKLSLKVSYGYWAIDDNFADTQVTKNLVFLEMRYEYPFFD